MRGGRGGGLRFSLLLCSGMIEGKEVSQVASNSSVPIFSSVSIGGGMKGGAKGEV